MHQIISQDTFVHFQHTFQHTFQHLSLNYFNEINNSIKLPFQQ